MCMMEKNELRERENARLYVHECMCVNAGASYLPSSNVGGHEAAELALPEVLECQLALVFV